jgi:hypothetical protein
MLVVLAIASIIILLLTISAIDDHSTYALTHSRTVMASAGVRWNPVTVPAFGRPGSGAKVISVSITAAQAARHLALHRVGGAICRRQTRPTR